MSLKTTRGEPMNKTIEAIEAVFAGDTGDERISELTGYPVRVMTFRDLFPTEGPRHIGFTIGPKDPGDVIDINRSAHVWYRFDLLDAELPEQLEALERSCHEAVEGWKRDCLPNMRERVA